ncbi:MAG: tRNA preQ1(34) S-adenosylmethionine ribosyltransferase-isomerase QueA [bacterium]
MTKQGSQDFCFDIPKESIAQVPLQKRDECKLLVYDRKKGGVVNEYFHNVLSFLKKDDCLVINETKVLPARFVGKKSTGGKMEILFIKANNAYEIEVLLKPGVRLNEKLFLEEDNELSVISRTQAGTYLVRWEGRIPINDYLKKFGVMPLPPYIKRKSNEVDASYYQTVFASKTGSVAAPTAGLHFSEDLLSKFEKMGVPVARLLLHIGLATFKKIKVDDFSSFSMLGEYYEVSKENAEVINNTKKKGGRIIAVGTSVVRTLETVGENNGLVHAESGFSRIFIYPGYVFKVVDALVTNFHLPYSGPLFLTAAFIHNKKDAIDESQKIIKNLYEKALEQKYRFYSYGDAMLII